MMRRQSLPIHSLRMSQQITLRCKPMDTLLYFRANCALSNTELVVSLQAHPDFRRSAEIPAEPNSCVSCYGAPAIHDSADAPGGYDDIAGEPVNADPHRLHEFLKENLPWRNWFKKFSSSSHFSPLMVVGYFTVIGVSVFPAKTDPPLIVNPYTILTLAIAL